LHIFFQAAKSAIFALLLTGCAHSVSPYETFFLKQHSPKLGHDEANGELYGHLTDALSGKTFKVIKVSDYVLPKQSPHISVRFQNGEIHLVGTCNPTWGNYELTGDFITLGAMGNLGQHACSQLLRTPDGRTYERLAQTPNVITEEKFVALGDKSLKIQFHQNEVYFIDQNENILITLER